MLVISLPLPPQSRLAVAWNKSHRNFFLNIILFIYLFRAALGPHCLAQAFSICGERGLLFIAVHGLLTAVASLVVEDGHSAHSLQYLCSVRAQELWLVGSGAQAQ